MTSAYKLIEDIQNGIIKQMPIWAIATPWARSKCGKHA